MGLFSSKRIIKVASTLYNMAGPEDERPDFLKGTVFTAVIQNHPSLGSAITKGYLDGPGIKQRIFFPYAVRKRLAGLPTRVTNTRLGRVSDTAFLSAIPKSDDQRIVLQNAQINAGDPYSFMEAWVLENHPGRSDSAWSGDYDGSDGTFEIVFAGGESHEFTDSSYSPSKNYLEVRYLLVDDSQEDGDELSSETTTVTEKIVPDGYEAGDTETLSETAQGTRTVTVTEPGNPVPTVMTETVTLTLNRSVERHSSIRTTGVFGHGFEGVRTDITFTGADTVETDGFSETVTDDDGTVTVTTGDGVKVQWTRVETETEVIVGGDVEEKLWLREITASDPVTSPYLPTSSSSGGLYREFYPFLPIRLDNVSVRESPYSTNGLWDETRRAYARVTDRKRLAKLVDQVEENEQIDDIDYAYIVWGCSLNVQEMACRRYIWDFLDKLISVGDGGSISEFRDSIRDYNAALRRIAEWERTDWSRVRWDERPPRPTLPNLSVPGRNLMKFETRSSLMPSFDIRLEWIGIEKTLHAGKFRFVTQEADGDTPRKTRRAKRKEVQFRMGTPVTWTEEESYTSRGRDNSGQRLTRRVKKTIEILEGYRQLSDNQYGKFVIGGMMHYNVIYKGKAVEISAREALEDEDPSGFFFPLHFPTFKEVGIVDYTQMSTANTYILFNSYKVVKQKWYQRGFFRIFLVILIVVVAIAFFRPDIIGALSGAFGTNAAVGAALGLTGTAAVVAGFVANYLASIVIFQILNVVASELFGEEFGALFASLVSLVFHFGINGFQFDAATILKIGDAVVSAYEGFVSATIEKIGGNLESLEESYEEQSERINRLLKELGGSNDLDFNPIILTDAARKSRRADDRSVYLPETLEDFLGRTTMTGTDVVNLTHAMVYSYPEIMRNLSAGAA